MKKKKRKVVPLLPKHPKTDIADSPAMKELEKLLKSGKLSPDRTKDHLEDEDEKGEG